MENKIKGGLVQLLDHYYHELLENSLFKKHFQNKELECIYEESFLESEKDGIELTFSKELLLISIRLIQTYETTKLNELNDILSFALVFNMSQQQIRNQLGVPEKSGGGQKDMFFENGIVPFWDKYFFSNATLHFQYSIDQTKIEIITIASLCLEIKPN